MGKSKRGKGENNPSPTIIRTKEERKNVKGVDQDF